jgi:hypothetical protein
VDLLVGISTCAGARRTTTATSTSRSIVITGSEECLAMTSMASADRDGGFPALIPPNVYWPRDRRPSL